MLSRLYSGVRRAEAEETTEINPCRRPGGRSEGRTDSDDAAVRRRVT